MAASADRTLLLLLLSLLLLITFSTAFETASRNVRIDARPHRTRSRGIAHNALLKFGTKPAKFILCSALNSYAKTQNLQLGLQIHAQIIRTCYEENLFIINALIDMYAKCGSFVDAKKVFYGMK
ncbi:hypothetical protein LguiA_005426 [Lonicera macranthoides]